jgi:hypothetical protein
MYKFILVIINIYLLSPEIIVNFKRYTLGLENAADAYSTFDFIQVVLLFPLYIILAPLYLKMIKEEITIRYITLFNVIMLLIYYYLFGRLNHHEIFLSRLVMSVVNIIYILTLKGNTNTKK